jgi:hypothetical protein
MRFLKDKPVSEGDEEGAEVGANTGVTRREERPIPAQGVKKEEK